VGRGEGGGRGPVWWAVRGWAGGGRRRGKEVEDRNGVGRWLEGMGVVKEADESGRREEGQGYGGERGGERDGRGGGA